MKIKRIMALVIALAMILSTMVFSASAEETPTKGCTLYIINADGTVAMDIDCTKSVSEFSIRTTLEDARVFADNPFLFGIVTPATYVIDMYEDSIERKSFTIGSDVTINGYGYNINLDEGVELINNGTINNATIVKPNDGEDVFYVAEVGGASYATLQEAIDAAADGAEIDIIADFSLEAQNANPMMKPAYNRESYAGVIIPDDKAITIDLNGKTISYVDEYGNCDNVMVLNFGNLTINDSVGNGKMTYKPVAGTNTYTNFYSTIFNCGALTINGGIIENTCETAVDVTNAVDNHSRLSHEYGNDCILTVNGGTLIGSAYYSIRQYTHYFEGVKNRVVINGGNFMNGIYMQHGDSWYYANPSSNRLNVDCQVEINGGVFNVNYEGAGVLVSRLSNPDNNAWKIAITDGTFYAPVKLRVQRGVYFANGVSGATVPTEATGARNAEWLEANGGFITGGTFADLGSADDVTTNLASFLAEGLKLAENEDGTYSVVEAVNNVAKIGDNEYATLAEAIAAAQNSETIELLADATIAATTNITKSITINGNNFTITQADNFSANGSNAMFDIMNGATATFNDVTFDGIKNSAIMRTVSADVVIDNCIVKNCEQTVAQGLLRLALGNATITDSQFINNTCSMVVTFGYDAANDEDILTIDGCLFENNTCKDTAVVYFADGDYGTATNTKFINNNTSAVGNAATLYFGWGDGFKISGCTFEGNTVTTSLATTKRFGSAIFCDGCEVTGNIFKNNTAIRNGETISTIVAVGAYFGAADVSANYWNDGSAPVLGVDYTVEYTRNPVENESYYAALDENGALSNLVITKNVAEVNGTPFATLAEAIAAAQNGETVKVLADIEVSDEIVIAADKTIALDLNGFTISRTQASTAVANSQLIKNLGNLTIKDSSAEKTGKLSYTYTGEKVAYSVSTISNVLATLTVESGTIENNTTTDYTGSNGAYAYAIDSLTNGNGGEASVTVNGGVIKANYMAIRQFVNSTTDNNILVVTDGEIVGGSRAINVQGSNTVTKASNTAVVNISGGTIKAVSQSGYSVCALSSSENMSISGGTLIGNIYSGAMGIISGGTYNLQPYEGYIADGFGLAENADGTYSVVSTKIEITQVTVTADETKLSVAIDGVNIPKSAMIYIASYHGNKLIETKLVDADNLSTELSASNVDNVRVFVWDEIVNPYCANAKVLSGEFILN